jgi:hypothetical protein
LPVADWQGVIKREASEMEQSSAGPQAAGLGMGEPGSDELGFCAWIGFWAPLVVLGVLAVLGAFFASDNSAPGDYACGLVLSLAALALAFMRVKNRFDGGAADWANFLLVDDVPSLVAVIVVFAVLGLAGLLVAAGVGHGGLHDGGVALFVVSGLAVFLSLKHVFDNLDRQP